MTEKQLIGEIEKLRQIKPGKDWVVFTKTQILGEEPKLTPKFSFFPYFKPAFAGLIAAFALIGLFSFSFNSLPGDILYPVKKIAEKSRAIFVSAEEKPAFQLKLANERLEDLVKADVKNLAPTISEFQSNLSEAAKNLAKIDATTSDPVVIRQIVKETKKLEGAVQRVRSLGMVVNMEEFESAMAEREASWVKDGIEILENQALIGVLTEEKEKILAKMKELAEEEKYSEALELYLINQ